MTQVLAANNPIEMIPLSLLEFDPQNPRLPRNIDGNNELDVISYLIDEANIPELMMSIGEQGYFDGEPLLVVESGNKYIVVEGNRRLCALKLLNSSQLAPRSSKKIEEIKKTSPNKPTNIPCQKFYSRDQILSYLGYRHITGVNQWDAIAKARYLDQLYTKFAENEPSLTPTQIHQKLAKVIASKSDYVAKLLTSLELLRFADDQKILKRLKKEQDDLPFSLITTALGYPNIREYIGIEIRNPDFSNVKVEELDNFFEWTFGIAHSKSRIGESRNFDKLNRIVSHSLALEKFKEGVSIDEADLYTEGPIQTLRNLLDKAKHDLSNAQGVLSLVSELEHLDIEQALQIKNLATQIHSSIKARVEEE